ncbi:MAG: hypothetical protein LUC44_00580 [Prevotellaceae bacterium]|nr:hypothetical protein [Prevotellaceae bacterium]
MTKSEYTALPLEERERYWLKALKNKASTEELLDAQYDYEMEPHVLYEDENIVLEKNYVTEFDLHARDDRDGGMTAGFEALTKRVDLGAAVGMEEYRGKTIVDYMRDRGFPLTFLTWI